MACFGRTLRSTCTAACAWATLSTAGGAATPCDSYAAAPAPAQRQADIARALAKYPEAKSFSLKSSLDGGDVRFAWLQSDALEPAVFLFRGVGSSTELVDVWGGVLANRQDRQDAERWALKAGASAQLSKCFADKLDRDGP